MVENTKMMSRPQMIGTAILICVAVALSTWSEYIRGNNTISPLYSELLKRREEITKEIAFVGDQISSPPPFSTLDPVADLNLYDYDHRPDISSPGKVFSELHKGQKYTGQALPTNIWYENMLLLQDGDDPSHEHRVYTIPYLLNTIGPVPGIKLHGTRLQGSDLSVQVTFNDQHGLTLGAANSLALIDLSDQGDDMGVMRRYGVDYVEGKRPGPLTPLGLTLKWECSSVVKEDDSWMISSFIKMTSSIVRGMPFGTMHYHYSSTDFGTTLPTVVSQIGLAGAPYADSSVKLTCANDDSKEGIETLVEKNVEIHFGASDYSWLVFYSEPVYVRCYTTTTQGGDTPFVLQVTRLANGRKTGNQEVVLTSRVALMNNCTRGTNPSHCFGGEPNDASDFSRLLKDHADVYPGKNTNIDYTLFSDEKDNGGGYSLVYFDWDARRTLDREPATPTESKGLLMYSLVGEQKL